MQGKHWRNWYWSQGINHPNGQWLFDVHVRKINSLYENWLKQTEKTVSNIESKNNKRFINQFYNDLISQYNRSWTAINASTKFTFNEKAQISRSISQSKVTLESMVELFKNNQLTFQHGEWTSLKNEFHSDFLQLETLEKNYTKNYCPKTWSKFHENFNQIDSNFESVNLFEKSQYCQTKLELFQNAEGCFWEAAIQAHNATFPLQIIDIATITAQFAGS